MGTFSQSPLIINVVNKGRDKHNLLQPSTYEEAVMHNPLYCQSAASHPNGQLFNTIIRFNDLTAGKQEDLAAFVIRTSKLITIRRLDVCTAKDLLAYINPAILRINNYNAIATQVGPWWVKQMSTIIFHSLFRKRSYKSVFSILGNLQAYPWLSPNVSERTTLACLETNTPLSQNQHQN